MFTIVASRITISWAIPSIARIAHRRSWCGLAAGPPGVLIARRILRAPVAPASRRAAGARQVVLTSSAADPSRARARGTSAAFAGPRWALRVPGEAGRRRRRAPAAPRASSRSPRGPPPRGRSGGAAGSGGSVAAGSGRWLVRSWPTGCAPRVGRPWDAAERSLRAVDLGRGAVEAVGLAGGGERRGDLLHLRDPPPALARRGVGGRLGAARSRRAASAPTRRAARPRRPPPAPSRGSRGAARPSPSSRRRRPSSAPRRAPGSRPRTGVSTTVPSNAAATVSASGPDRNSRVVPARSGGGPTIPPSTKRPPAPSTTARIPATVAGDTAFASTNSPPRPATSRATARAACGGHTDRTMSDAAASRGGRADVAQAGARPRARAVAALRPSPAHSTSWPALTQPRAERGAHLAGVQHADGQTRAVHRRHAMRRRSRHGQ